MRKITLSCLSLLVAGGVAYAGTPCDGFEVKIKNNTPDKFLVTNMQLKGGEFSPTGLETIPAHSEQIFVVNHTKDGEKMQAEMKFHTISIPSKRVSLEFSLENKHLICHHNTIKTSGDYKIDHTRLPGKITYSIN